MVRRYEIKLVIDTPYNPDKWDWTELVASEEHEEIISLSCNELDREVVA